MVSGKIMVQEPKGYKVFPTGHSIRHSGLFGLDSDENENASTKSPADLPQTFSVNISQLSFDDLDLFLEHSMNELDHISASRSDLKARTCGIAFKSEGRFDSLKDKSWENAIVDCRIELPDESIGSDDSMDVVESCYIDQVDVSFYHSFRGNSIIYDPGLQDEDGITYCPSSNGLHRSHHSSHLESYDVGRSVSPTRCFSRIFKGMHATHPIPYRVNDQWRTQSITPLTDKAIASAFTKCTKMDIEPLGFDSYSTHFYNVEFNGVMKEPAKLTVSTKGDWNPRDIKMCSPFKACRGEASKVTKSGGPVYGDGSHYEVGRALDNGRQSLDGLYVVTADVDSDDDIESYEHLYKAEFDLLVERKEHVDAQEMEEWYYQAGLTAGQIRSHYMAFNRLLKLNCKYFGKRVYPYRGELDSVASKFLHVLNPHTNKFEVGITVAKIDKQDLRKTKKRLSLDMCHVNESTSHDPGLTRSINLTVIPTSTHRLFEYETEKRPVRNSLLKAGASNAHQLYRERTASGFENSPSIGIRDAFSDFQAMSPRDEPHIKVPQTLQQFFPAPGLKETNTNHDAASTNQGNFILKILLRFPYLDLKQLGLTTF